MKLIHFLNAHVHSGQYIFLAKYINSFILLAQLHHDQAELIPSNALPKSAAQRNGEKKEMKELQQNCNVQQQQKEEK